MSNFMVKVEVDDSNRSTVINMIHEGSLNETLSALLSYYLDDSFDKDAFEKFRKEHNSLDEKFKEFAMSYSKEATMLKGISQVIGTIREDE